MREQVRRSYRAVPASEKLQILAPLRIAKAHTLPQTGHIIMNLASLYFMAPPVIMMLGNTGFLALYLFAVRREVILSSFAALAR